MVCTLALTGTVSLILFFIEIFIALMLSGGLGACAKSPVITPHMPKTMPGVVRFTVLAPGAKLALISSKMGSIGARASTSSTFFMFQLEGATSDPAKFDGLRTLLPDYTRTTPEQMQALFHCEGLFDRFATLMADAKKN